MIIQFPNERVPLAISGVKDPLFITDIQNANQSLLLALKIMLGYPFTGSGTFPIFAILGGMKNNGMGGYGPGYVYANGDIYFVDDAVIHDGQYLNPTTTLVENVKASDGSYNYSYKVYSCTMSATVVGGLPVITGNMDAYRFNLQFINAANILTGTIPIARLPFKTVNIGNWNMNSLSTIVIPLTDFGLTNDVTGANKVKTIEVMIRSDDNTAVKPLNSFYVADYSINGAFQIINDSGTWNLHLYRRTGGEFDATVYQTSPYNRGFATLEFYDI